MTDERLPDLPLLFRATGAEYQSFTTRLGVHFRVQSDGTGIPVRGWRLGESGELAVSNIDGAVLSIGVPLEGQGSLLEWAESEVQEFSELQASVAWGERARGISADKEGTRQNQIWFGDGTPTHWHRLSGTELMVALDDSQMLVAIVFPTEIDVPTTKRVTLRIDGKLHASAYGDRGFSIGVFPDVDEAEMFGSSGFWGEGEAAPPPACPVYDYLHSPDGTFNVALRPDGILEGIDGPVTVTGTVTVPSVDDSADSLDAELHWPTETKCVVEVIDDTHARIGVEFGDSEPAKWISLSGGLLVGVSSANELVRIVAPDAEHVPQHDPFDDMMFGDDQDAMMEHMRQQAAEHGSEELARARRFVESQPFAALALVEPPIGSRSMEARGSVWGKSDSIKSVSLKYGSEMEMFGENPDRTLPLVEVAVGLEPEDTFMRPDHASQDASWLAHTTIMIVNPLEEPQSTRESQEWFKSIEARGKELDASFEPVEILVDGVAHEGRVTRTEVGYVAKVKVDDRYVTIKAVNRGQDIAPLETATEFEPFLDGLAESMEKIAAMMRQAQDTMGRKPAPPEAQAAKQAVEKLGRKLQQAGDKWGPPSGSSKAAPLFSSSVVERWGGAEQFEQRFALYSGVVDISGKFQSTTEDGSVAHMTITVSLPRPDGSRSIMLSMSDQSWWEETEDSILAAAAEQLERDQMPEYELELNALARRVDGNRYVIDTDVFELIDRYTGGLQELLRPTAGT